MLPIQPEAIVEYLDEIREHPDPNKHPFYYHEDELRLTPSFKGWDRFTRIKTVIQPLLAPGLSPIASVIQALHNQYGIAAGVLSVGHPLVQPYRIYKTYTENNIPPPDIMYVAQKSKGGALPALVGKHACLKNPDLRFVHLDDMHKHLESLLIAHKLIAAEGGRTKFTPMHVINPTTRAFFAAPRQRKAGEMALKGATVTNGAYLPEIVAIDAAMSQEQIVRRIMEALEQEWDPSRYDMFE